MQQVTIAFAEMPLNLLLGPEYYCSSDELVEHAWS
jgi:hypothetical protein